MTSLRPDEPIDGLDLRILAAVRDLWTAADPRPPTWSSGSAARSRCTACAWGPSVAVCRQRTGSDDVGRITFDSDALTISLSVGVNRTAPCALTAAVPPGSHDVELRTADQRLCTRSDVHGRFTITDFATARPTWS